MKQYITVFKIFLILSLFFLSYPIKGTAQEETTSSNKSQVANKIVEKLTLTKATMCESINNFIPENEAIVFSVESKRVFCFTNFNPVPKKMYVYHIWYYKDAVITKHRLSLNPPQWSTYSSMQLRDYDKGPWRVEITDENNKIFRILRFSVTD